MSNLKQRSWIIVGLALLLCGATAIDKTGFFDSGVSIYAEDADLDGAYEIVALDGAFAQIAATDSIEILPAAAADSGRVIIGGILADSTYHEEYVRFSGTNVVPTVKKYLYYESARIDSGHALTAALGIRRATGDTHISEIAVGKTQDYTAHYFPGKHELAQVELWQAGVTSTTGTVNFELRWYHDWQGSRGTSGKTGYNVLDRILLPATLGESTEHILNVNLENGSFPGVSRAQGFLAVYGLGGTANADGKVRMRIKRKGGKRGRQ